MEIMVLLNKVVAEGRGVVGSITPQKINGDDTLHEMYRLLKCDCVDVRQFELDGHLYDVWFDDEFMIKDGPKIPTVLLTANEGLGHEVLICGSVMFAKTDSFGNTIGLNDNDIKRLMSFAKTSGIKAVRYAMAMMGR